MSKFKVGDRVKLDGVHMGTVLDVSSPGNVVVEMDDPALGTEVPQFPGRKVWWLSEDRFTKVRAARKILITHDGTTTIARLFEGNKVIKSAEAKCAPGDTFDFAVGANLAYDRLMRPVVVAKPVVADKPKPIKLYCVKDSNGHCGFEQGKVYTEERGRIYGENGISTSYSPDWFKEHFVPLIQRPAKVGEWVYITDDGFWPNHDLLHKLAKCVGLSGGDSTLRFDDGDRLYVSPRRYLVLDGHQPEPEYYNGKVVCIKAYGGFTAGKVYCFTDGVCGDNDGDKRPESGRRPISDLSDGWARDIFIEFKGEAQ